MREGTNGLFVFVGIEPPTVLHPTQIKLYIKQNTPYPTTPHHERYGLTAVDFWPYFWASLLGFLPGTVAYVYSGAFIFFVHV